MKASAFGALSIIMIRDAVLIDAGAIDFAVISVGALADAELLDELCRRARAFGVQLLIPAGAGAGIDALAAARTGGIECVVYTSRKPPAASKGTAAETACDLDSLTEAVVHYQGDARRAARLYPKNANVAASIALAAASFEDREVSLVADPAVRASIHEIEAEGAFGRLHVTVNGATLPDNLKTSPIPASSATDARWRPSSRTPACSGPAGKPRRPGRMGRRPPPAGQEGMGEAVPADVPVHGWRDRRRVPHEHRLSAGCHREDCPTFARVVALAPPWMDGTPSIQK